MVRLTRQTLRELESSAPLRVIAVRPNQPGRTLGAYDWNPDLARRPAVGDRIVAVATTSGFSWLNARNGTPA